MNRATSEILWIIIMLCCLIGAVWMLFGVTGCALAADRTGDAWENKDFPVREIKP